MFFYINAELDRLKKNNSGKWNSNTKGVEKGRTGNILCGDMRRAHPFKESAFVAGATFGQAVPQICGAGGYWEGGCKASPSERTKNNIRKKPGQNITLE